MKLGADKCSKGTEFKGQLAKFRKSFIWLCLKIHEEQKNPQVKIFCRSQDKGIYCFLLTLSMIQASNLLYVSPLNAGILVPITLSVFVRSDWKSSLLLFRGREIQQRFQNFKMLKTLPHLWRQNPNIRFSKIWQLPFKGKRLEKRVQSDPTLDFFDFIRNFWFHVSRQRSISSCYYMVGSAIWYLYFRVFDLLHER